MIGRLRSLVSRGSLALRALAVRHGLWTTDLARWRDERNLQGAWDQRTARLAGLIPAGSRVLEFGAGRMALRGYLPPGCSYLPTDVVPRGEGVVLCDLNVRPLPQFPAQDVVVFSGVLEYVTDVPLVARYVAGFASMVVASYAAVDIGAERGALTRRSLGWVNDYRASELMGIFAAAGFSCDQTDRWEGQMLFRLTRQPNVAVSSAT